MEDMCDGFGSKYNNKPIGTFGDVSTLSFYPVHHITTGEGGAVLTSNTKLKLLNLRTKGTVALLVKTIHVKKDLIGSCSVVTLWL